MINVLLAVQLKLKLSMNAKQYLMFAKFAEKYGQKTGFKRHLSLTYVCGIKF